MFFSSIFLSDGEEISRVAESVNLETQKVIFHEEFFPIGTVDTQTLEFYQRQTEQLPLSLLNLSLSNL